MTKTKNFSFSDFMSFSESLVDSLETISNKIEEVTNQITTLETVLEGDDAAAPTEEPVSAEENVEVADANTDANTDAEIPADDAAMEEPTEVAVEEGVEETVPAATTDETPAEDATEEVTEEAPADDANTDANAENPAEETAPVSEEDNDSAAIDAMSTGDENFSDKFMVVSLKNRPWGNRVIAAKDFSEKEHNKIIPTLFSTKAQAQRAMTSYNVNGPANFSIRYNHINQMFGMNAKSETKVINASESGSRYDKVKSIFGM